MSSFAKVVLSLEGYWVGFEIHPGEQYISFDEVKHRVPVENLLVITIDDLLKDLAEILGIEIKLLPHGDSDKLIRHLAHEMCHNKYGFKYCSDRKSPFGVRKIDYVLPNQDKP